MTTDSARYDRSTTGSLSTASSTVVSAIGLGKRVGDGALAILDDVSFHIPAGESVAVTGRSGSGKSTLLALLAGLDAPTAGEAWLSGVRIDRLDEDARAALRAGRVGFVFQSFQLLPAMTALENVMLPLEIGGHADAETQAREWLHRVGLADRTGHYPRQLSGGEQQRVAIARAFAVRPAILFADEPTGNLDTGTGQQIADLLFASNREAGTTLILVTHDTTLAARCARQLHLEAGRLIHDSRPAERLP
ncbi:MAG: ABC transporter ATP-binding protein [Pseudomonadota bacterium]